MEKFFDSFSTPLTNEQIEEYENLDKIRETAMIYAERHCRNLFMGGVSWCPRLTRQRARIDYIRACISKKKGTKINSRTLIRKSKRVAFDASHFTMDELMKALDTEFTEYKKLKKNHVEARKSYLEDLAEALASQGKGKKASHLRNLIKIEEQRAIFKKLKYVMGNNSNLGTTFVTVKTETGEKVDIIDKEEMEKAIIRENTKKYHQTEQTCPFIYDEQLRHDFGELGSDGAKTKELLEGTYKIPDHVDKYTRAFLETCKYNEDHQPAEFERDGSIYKRSWELMDERISSRRLHFGHFKAACKSESIIDLHYKMAEIPFRTGYAPNRWKEATNVMILKKAGLYDIEKLRTIVLYEADFNHNNKYFGKHMMEHTIRQNMLAKEQYSTPGKKAVDHALNRRLIFDIVRYKKTSFAMTSCDLKSCYDRIAHVPAYLAMTGYKYLPTPLLSMFSCIQDMMWVTRTAYGDSLITFGGRDKGFNEAFWASKPQGVGQGNGSGPSVWAVVSSRMFEVLHNQGLATSFIPPISNNKPLDICGFAFVDDSDIIASAKNKNDPAETIRQMQETIDWWEGVAKTTGGALEPSKSWWYLVHFEWEDGEWRYGDLPQDLNNLTALDKHNNRVNLQHISVEDTQTMLGVDMAPNGDNASQVAIMKQKTTTMGELIRTGSLTHNEAWTALQLMAMKSIEYPLAASTFTEKELQSIMWPILKHYLPKSGINRNISREILYGPSALGGMGLNNPYITQGINHVIDITDHLWKNTLTGQLIRNCIEHLQLEVGTNDNLLTLPIHKYQQVLLTQSWIRHTWNFISTYGLKIHVRIGKFGMRRKGDQILMDHIINNDSLSSLTKRGANKCRIFLRALSLADIVTGDGKRICHFASYGYQNLRQTRTSIDWPLWGQPSRSDWKAWRTAIRLTFCKRKEGIVDEPLGPWIETISEDWEWFESTNDDKLYRRYEDGTWEKFECKGRSPRRKQFQISGITMTTLPPTVILLPTTVTTAINYYQGEGSTTVINNTTSTTKRREHIPWLHNSVEQTEVINDLIEEVKLGSAIAVSDGSYCPERRIGTSAWTIETTSAEGKQYLRGTSISPGHPKIQNAYRSELLGLLGILDVILFLCEKYEIRKGGITIACDGKSALNQIQRDPESLSCKMLQSDIISACVNIIKLIPIQINYQHVAGHQDDKKFSHELTGLERANVWADETAKETMKLYWRENTNIHVYKNFSPHPEAFNLITHHDNTVSSSIGKTLHFLIAGELLHKYWIKKGRYSLENQDQLCWEAHDHARRNSSTSKKRFVSKWISEFLGTGKNVKRWGFRPQSNCPFCLEEDETTLHIIQCPHQEAHSAWDRAMTKWFQQLIKIGLDPVILVGIRQELNNWKHDTETEIHTGKEDIDKLLLAQRSVGWQQFLEGLLTEQWFRHLYPENENKRYNTIAQISKVIRANWEFLFMVWMERNEKLHETDRIKDFEGRPQLLRAIEKEWNIGLSILPHNDFGYLFTIRKEHLLDKSLDSLKDWLAIVRRGRELHNDPRLITDDFTQSGTLRSWLGLPHPTHV